MFEARSFIPRQYAVAVLSLSILVAGCGSEGTVETFASSPAEATTSAAPAGAVPDPEIDFAGIAAELTPVITEDDFVIVEHEVGTLYTYAFAPIAIGDGVTMQLEAVWESRDDGFVPYYEWTLVGEASSPADFAFTVSLPKSSAADASQIQFIPEPASIINPDPVFQWVADFADLKEQIFAAVMPVLSDPESPDVAFGALLGAANQLAAHHDLQRCRAAVATEPTWANQCFLTVVALHPDSFAAATCNDSFNLATGESSNPISEPYRLACHAMAGFSTGRTDACGSASDLATAERCRQLTFEATAWPCTYLSGVDESICVYEAAVASGDVRFCNGIGADAMSNDCRAILTGDASYCAAIEDEAQRSSCCSEFPEAAECEASDVAAASSTTTTTTTTTTAAPPPLGGDVASPTTDGFEAVYDCIHNDRGTTYESQVRYWWDGRMMTTPYVGSGTEWEPIVPQYHGDFFYELHGSVGPVARLDGTSFQVPAESLDLDESEYGTDIHNYGPLVVAPGGEQRRDIAGWEWAVVPYQGSHDFTRNLYVDSLGTITTVDQVESFSLSSWYHVPTGLLMESWWERNRSQDVNNYGGETYTGVLQGATCRLSYTTLDLGG